MLFALIELAHGRLQQRHARVELVGLDQLVFLAFRIVIGQPVLPLALTLGAAQRRVERGIGTGQAPVHRHHVLGGHAQLGGDRLDLFRLEIALFQGLHLALHAAQVEEQLLLGRGRAHLHQRPGPQDVFLDRGADPPHGVGRQTETLFRVELLDGLHQADIAFRDHLGDRQAVAAIAHGDLGDETQVGSHQLLGGFRILVLAPALAQHEFLILGQHREAADLRQVARQALFGRERD